MAQRTESPPANASVVFETGWAGCEVDRAARRSKPQTEPMSVYEMQLGSWRQRLDYRSELGPTSWATTSSTGLHARRAAAGDGAPVRRSWGYQVTGCFAPTRASGPGRPARARRPAARARARRDPRLGAGPLPARRVGARALRRHRALRARRSAPAPIPTGARSIFNYGRSEVRNFLLASALYWLERVPRRRPARGRGGLDALPRLLARATGEWVPNEHGGRENLEAIGFLRELNEVVHGCEPGVVDGRRGVDRLARRLAADVRRAGSASASSGTWAGCTTRSTTSQHDPMHRRYHHDELTFSLVYAFTRELRAAAVARRGRARQGLAAARRCPATAGRSSPTCARSTATCGRTRARSCCSWAASSRRGASGTTTRSLDWHLLEQPGTRGVQRLVARPQPRSTAPSRRCGSSTSSRPASRWLERGRPDATCSRSRGLGATARVARVRRATSRRCARRATASACRAGGRWREVLNTDADALRRLRVGNLRRRRRRGAAVARPAALGRGDAAAARRGLARPGRRVWMSRLAGHRSRSGPVGTGRHELLALLRERRAGRALPLRRRRTGGRASRSPSGPRSTGTATSRRRARTALRLPRPRPARPEQRPALQPGQAADRPVREGDRGADPLRRGERAAVRRRRRRADLEPDDRTTLAAIPKSSSIDQRFEWEGDRPRTPWHETVIYEMHVGASQGHPGCGGSPRNIRRPRVRRGDRASQVAGRDRRGAAPRSITSPTRVPLRARAHELLGLSATVGFLAPHALYAATGTRGEEVRQFKGMVKALHQTDAPAVHVLDPYVLLFDVNRRGGCRPVLQSQPASRHQCKHKDRSNERVLHIV